MCKENLVLERERRVLVEGKEKQREKHQPNERTHGAVSFEGPESNYNLNFQT